MSRGWSVLVFAVLAACFRAQPPDGAIACGAEPHPCPQGYRCAIDRTCRRGADPAVDLASAASDAGTGFDLAAVDLTASDGALGDAAMPCLKTGCLTDDFNDGIRASIWTQGSYEIGGGKTAESGGTLVATLPDPTPLTGAWGAYKSDPHDLTGSQVAIEIVQTTNTATNALVFLALTQITTDNNWLQISEYGNQLVIEEMLHNMNMVIASIPFNPLQHHWWRIRESAGAVLFETSDGFTWSPRATVATPFFASAVSVEIGAGANGMVSAPGQALLDNLNLGPL